MSSRGGPAPRAQRAVDLALLSLAVILSGVTLAVSLVPEVAPALVNERLEVAIVTAWALSAFGIAGLEWARGRAAGDGAALLRASAFATLAVLNGLSLAVSVLGLDTAYGVTLDDPGQLPVVAGLLARGASAILLLAAGLVALRGAGLRRRPFLTVVGPPAFVFAALLLATLLRDRLPQLVGPDAMRSLADAPAAGLPPGSAPVLVLLHAGIAAAFLAAALLAHRTYLRTGRVGTALLAGGLVVAAFGQVHGAIHPGGYTGVVTSGDLLRLGFYAVLVAAAIVDRRDDLAELRAANAEVRRLADAELATAALEERARLAREIHDGLAQDLWYAKLKQTRLAQIAALEGEQRELSDEVEGAIDAALAEARNAIAAMREGAEAGPLLDLLERQVEDFADRFALRAEFRASGPSPDVPPRAKAELLRIVQEALTNVRRHADATTVRVLVHSDGVLRLTIIDNGRGFEPDQVPGGFGLDSMRQRAAVIGATLTIASEPRNGTRIELMLPNTQEGNRTHGA